MSAGGTSGVGSGTLTKFVDQFSLEQLNEGKLAEGENLSQFGAFLQQGKASDASLITGSVMQEVGATMRSIAQAHTMSRLAKAKVQCLAIELAKQSVQQQQGVMEKVIEAFKENLALQERIRQDVKQLHEQHRQDLKDITTKGFQLVMQEENERKQAILLQLLDEERKGIKEGYQSTQKTLTALAKSAKIDPEIIDKCVRQSTEIIKDICKTVRTITMQNEEQALVDISQNALKLLKSSADQASQAAAGSSGTT